MPSPVDPPPLARGAAALPREAKRGWRIRLDIWFELGRRKVLRPFAATPATAPAVDAACVKGVAALLSLQDRVRRETPHSPNFVEVNASLQGLFAAHPTEVCRQALSEPQLHGPWLTNAMGHAAANGNWPMVRELLQADVALASGNLEPVPNRYGTLVSLVRRHKEYELLQLIGGRFEVVMPSSGAHVTFALRQPSVQAAHERRGLYEARQALTLSAAVALRRGDCALLEALVPDPCQRIALLTLNDKLALAQSLLAAGRAEAVLQHTARWPSSFDGAEVDLFEAGTGDAGQLVPPPYVALPPSCL